MRRNDILTDQHGSTDRVTRIDSVVQRALRDLPPQPAPASLRQNVLARIDDLERAWWRRAFTVWPLHVRVTFALLCTALAKLSVDGSIWLLASTRDLMRFDSALLAGWRALTAVQTSLLAGIPSLWWYGALTTIAVACGGVFAIGTIAYRTLYLAR